MLSYMCLETTTCGLTIHCFGPSRTGSPESTSTIVSSVQHMATMMTGVQQTSSNVVKRWEQEQSEMRDVINGLKGQMAAFCDLLVTRVPASPPVKRLKQSTPPSTQPDEGDSSHSPTSAAADPLESPGESSQSTAGSSSVAGILCKVSICCVCTGCVRYALKLAPSVQVESPEPPNRALWPIRDYARATPAAVDGLKNVTAASHYQDSLAGKNNLKPVDQSRGESVVACFRAAATPQERKLLTRDNLESNKAQVSSSLQFSCSCCVYLLLPSHSIVSGFLSQVTALINVLHNRVVMRLIKCYTDKNLKPTKVLSEFKPLTVCSLADRFKEIKRDCNGCHKSMLLLPMTEDEAQTHAQNDPGQASESKKRKKQKPWGWKPPKQPRT
jgi:hypothetical protein